MALYGKVPPEDYEQLDYVYRMKAEVQTMLVAALEQERMKIYQQGEAAGIAKGEAAGIAKGEVRGRIETQQQTIRQLLQFRFELTEAEQNKFVQQVTKIQNLQHLDELANLLLNKVAQLEDFIRILTKHPPNE